MNYNLILISIFINFLLLFFFKKISSLYSIYDSGDGIRKFQTSPVSLIGGSLIFFNFTFFLCLNFFFKINLLEEKFFSNNRELFSLSMGSLLFFIFGVLDDKYKLQANIKLFITFFLTLLIVMIDRNLLITNLKFSNFEHIIQLNIFSYFFTVLCFLLFINALNMFDGINLQVGFYCILVFSIFILKGVFLDLSLVIILSLIFFLFLNYKNKSFLGESGVQFLFRVAKGKHPFKGDTEHLHYLLLRYFSMEKTFLIIFLFILSTTILYNFIQYKNLFIIFYCILYCLVIFYLKKRK